MAKTAKASRMTPPIRLKDGAEHPVEVRRMCHPDVWAYAMEQAGGDKSKIRILSYSEVEIIR